MVHSLVWAVLSQTQDLCGVTLAPLWLQRKGHAASSCSMHGAGQQLCNTGTVVDRLTVLALTGQQSNCTNHNTLLFGLSWECRARKPGRPAGAGRDTHSPEHHHLHCKDETSPGLRLEATRPTTPLSTTLSSLSPVVHEGSGRLQRDARARSLDHTESQTTPVLSTGLAHVVSLIGTVTDDFPTSYGVQASRP